jgi:hypothetical protein
MLREQVPGNIMENYWSCNAELFSIHFDAVIIEGQFILPFS